jgi:hypothetical protein
MVLLFCCFMGACWLDGVAVKGLSVADCDFQTAGHTNLASQMFSSEQ